MLWGIMSKSRQLLSMTYDTCHEKTDLKVFVVVIAWLAGTRQSFFGYDTDYKILLYCLHRFYFLVSVILLMKLEKQRQP